MKLKIGWLNLKLFLWPTIAFIGLLILLISLGNWQLSRSEEKAQFIAAQARYAGVTATLLDLETEGDVKKLRFKNVELSGSFDIHQQFLLDNQIRHGKPGYFVLSPFKIKALQKAVLVNRGWIPVGQDRTILPTVSFFKNIDSVKGRINDFPEVGYKLPGAEIPTEGWPAVVQVVDTNILADKLGYSLLPFQIELDNASGEGYLREWLAPLTVAISPEKHTAYAFQWFGLALTLTVLFFWYSSKAHHD